MASIRKRTWKTGSGEPRTAFAVDYTDSNGERGQKQFPTRREAADFRASIEGQIRTSTFRIDAGRVTVKQAAEQFLETAKGRRDRNERMTAHTYEMYEGHVWNYISPDAERHKGKRRHKKLVVFSGGIGAVKLSQLTAGRVGAFRDQLRDAGVSVPTARKVIATLKVILEHAIANDLVAVNVARRVTVIGRRDEGSRKIVLPSKETVQRLLAVADEDFRVQLLFAAMSGVRAGELHALRWKHLDLDEGEVSIETRVDAHRKEDVTKTKAGMRSIPLGSGVVLALKEWKLRAKRKKPDDIVFPNRRGWYESHDNMVKRRFLPLFDSLAAKHAKEPGKNPAPPPRFNWHALRHFAISCWIEAGLAPKTVQTFAGHSSLAVTMDRYGHLFKSDDHRKAMDAIAGTILG